MDQFLVRSLKYLTESHCLSLDSHVFIGTASCYEKKEKLKCSVFFVYFVSPRIKSELLIKPSNDGANMYISCVMMLCIFSSPQCIVLHKCNWTDCVVCGRLMVKNLKSWLNWNNKLKMWLCLFELFYCCSLPAGFLTILKWTERKSEETITQSIPLEASSVVTAARGQQSRIKSRLWTI